MLAWPEVVIGQGKKPYQKRRGGVTRRLAQGTAEQLRALLPVGQVLSTAYIARLNATCRQRLFALVRRTRCLLRQQATLEAGMYLVGCVYNCCTLHKSLRREQPEGRRKGEQRTPAMAAGLASEVWTVSDLLTYRVPRVPYIPPKRRGRPPKRAVTLNHT